MKKILIVFITFLFLATTIFADEEPKATNEKSGFFYEVGLGPAYAGLGIHFGAYIQNGKSFSSMIFAGAGKNGFLDKNAPKDDFGFVVGGRLLFGKDHRFMVEYTYGDIELYSTKDVSYIGSFPGSSLCIGYQLMIESGNVFNISGGISLIEDYLFFNSNIGLGWKF